MLSYISYFIVLLLAALPMLGRASSPIRDDEQVQLQPNFRLSDYSGLWYELYRTSGIPFESGTDNQVLYSQNADGTISIMNKEYLPQEHRWHVAMATAFPVGNSHLKVKYSPTSPPGDYRVLMTDYNSISLVFSQSHGQKPSRYGWILGRSPQCDTQLLGHAFSIFKERVDLDKSDFMETRHGVAPLEQEVDY